MGSDFGHDVKYFQDGARGVISRRKVLPSGECTHNSARHLLAILPTVADPYNINILRFGLEPPKLHPDGSWLHWSNFIGCRLDSGSTSNWLSSCIRRCVTLWHIIWSKTVSSSQTLVDADCDPWRQEFLGCWLWNSNYQLSCVSQMSRQHSSDGF